MTPTPLFHGRVDKSGRLELLDTERWKRQQHLRSLAGKRVEVIIRKAHTKRSLDMNAYLHKVPFPMLAEHFGDSIEGVKLDLMGECFGWTKTAQGHDIPMKSHTSDMTVEESKFFLDWLIPWAMTTHGIDIPPPQRVSA